jgi:hypothetical protein
MPDSNYGPSSVIRICCSHFTPSASPGAIAVRPDQIGINTDGVPGFDLPLAGLLGQRIGPRPECQQADLDPLATQLGIGLTHDQPDGVL